MAESAAEAFAALSLRFCDSLGEFREAVVPLVLEQAASARSAGRLIAERLDGLQSRQCSAIQSTGST